MRRCHTSAAFVCPICEDLFAAYPDYERHCRDDHRDEYEENKCQVLRVKTMPANLTALRCKHCSKVFHAISLEQMRRHVARAHAGQAFDEVHLDFQCRVCMKDEQNDDMAELLEHIKSNHGEEGEAGGGAVNGQSSNAAAAAAAAPNKEIDGAEKKQVRLLCFSRRLMSFSTQYVLRKSAKRV